MVQTGLASFASVVVLHSLDSQWFPSTCQRWKSQVGRHHELRDKGSISQSSTSGWGAQDGGGLLASWTCAIGTVSVLTVLRCFCFYPQAFVIAVTSDFIPRLVYQYSYSHNGTLHGFVNHTLSFFNVSQLKEGTQPENSQFEQEVQFCR